MFFLISFVLLSGISISIVGFSLYTGISPMPSSSKVKKRLLSDLDETPKIVYELGSGWGTLIFPIARKFPMYQIKAYELSFIPWCVSSLICKLKKYPNVKIYRKNFFSIPLEEADLVICYLFPGAMAKLKSKFEKELKRGSFVISNSFAIQGWIPDRVVRVNDCWKSELFTYLVLSFSSERI